METTVSKNEMWIYLELVYHKHLTTNPLKTNTHWLQDDGTESAKMVNLHLDFGLQMHFMPLTVYCVSLIEPYMIVKSFWSLQRWEATLNMTSLAQRCWITHSTFVLTCPATAREFRSKYLPPNKHAGITLDGS